MCLGIAAVTAIARKAAEGTFGKARAVKLEALGFLASASLLRFALVVRLAKGFLWMMVMRIRLKMRKLWVYVVFDCTATSDEIRSQPIHV